MTDLDWSTPEGLAAIREHLAARIDGWRQPVAYAVALSPASSSPEWVFAHVNGPGGGTGCPRWCWRPCWVTTGRPPRCRCRRPSSRQPWSRSRPLRRAPPWSTRTSRPGARCSAELEGNPAREAQAVFVADLDDPVGSEADGSMRATFEGHVPEL